MNRTIRIAVAAVVSRGTLGVFAGPAFAYPPSPCSACPAAQQ
jgi:hypothetical protein